MPITVWLARTFGEAARVIRSEPWQIIEKL